MLTLQALSLQRGAAPLVQGLSAELGAGICGVLGRNGAGKSTLLAALAGLLRPSTGRIVYGAMDIATLTPRERAAALAYLPQREPDEFWGDVLAYTTLGRIGRSRGRFGPLEEDFAAAKAALKRFGLGDFLHRRLAELSGGERQLVRLAQVAAQDAAVWLLDEPLAHLDLYQQQRVLQLLGDAARNAGKLVIVTLHEPLWAASRCDHLLLLYDAARFQIGPRPTLLTKENLEDLYRCSLDPLARIAPELFAPGVA